MDDNIIIKIDQSMKMLDKIADTHGCVRAATITLLCDNLMGLKGMVRGMAAELEKLRRFKEEHTDNEDNSDEVPAES